MIYHEMALAGELLAFLTVPQDIAALCSLASKS